MPFKSEAQRRWMYAKDPEMAKRWEAETPDREALPEHVKDARKHAIAKMREGRRR